jgi:hypothetical protein
MLNPMDIILMLHARAVGRNLEYDYVVWNTRNTTLFVTNYKFCR